MTTLNFATDVGGRNTFAPQFTNDNVDIALTSGMGEQTTTVPARFSNCLAVFGYAPGAEVWVANNTTATLPGSSFATTDSQMNPAARQVKGGDVLHFITADTTANVCVSYYEL